MTEKDKELENLDIEKEITANEPEAEARQELEQQVEEKSEEPAAEEKPTEDTAEESTEPPENGEESSEKSETEDPEEEVKVYEPAEKKTEEEAPALITQQQSQDAPRQTITPAVQYSRSLERERKIAQEVKKRQRRPMVFILAMCVVLIILAIIVNAVLNDTAPDRAQPTPVPTQTVIIPEATVSLPQHAETPPPVEEQPAQEPVAEATPEPTEEPKVEKVSTYEIFREDISWTAARDKCIEKGGHLAVISTQEEFDRIITIAEMQGVEKLWIGCFRQNGNMVWVTDDPVEYYPWAKGEPTVTDSLDGAAEDYVLLWNNRGWFYNDSRNDPAGEFPQWYSGSIGYICEFED